jgi:hypothetical protein
MSTQAVCPETIRAETLNAAAGNVRFAPGNEQPQGASSNPSTGPRTDAGKAISSQNGITHGLFTATGFIRPGEETAYNEFTARLRLQIQPAGVLEEELTEEIRSAMWLLRRCRSAESNIATRIGIAPGIDPLESDNPQIDIALKSIERARAHAHRVLKQSEAHLRRLQTERQVRQEVFIKGTDASDLGLADYHAVMKAASTECRGALLQRSIESLDGAALLREVRLPDATPLNPDRRTALQKNQGFALQKTNREFQPSPAVASPEQTEQFVLQKRPSAPPRPEFALQKSGTPAVASPEQSEQFVLQKYPSAPPKPEFALQRSAPKPSGTPRNAKCPCGSNQKHKRCCGKDAPPRLQAA